MHQGALGGEIGEAGAGWKKECAEHQRRHGCDFSNSEDVLDDAAELHADVVDGGEEKNDHGGESFDADVFEWSHIADKREMQGPGSNGRREFWQMNELSSVFG